MNQIEPREYIKYLPCDLTADELLEKGRSLAERHAEIADIRRQMKEKSSEFKEQISEIEGDISTLTKEIRSRAEHREVIVVEKFDFAEKRVAQVRKDTGEQVYSRPMSEDELQAPLL